MRHLLMVAIFCALSVPALAQQKFQAQLNGAQEVPPNQTHGNGTAQATLDGNTLHYTVEYSGLSGPATAAHIHGPADPNHNAPVVIPFANPASPIKGTAPLNEQQQADLKSGKYYVNVHTQQNPAGEIRGQLKPAQ